MALFSVLTNSASDIGGLLTERLSISRMSNASAGAGPIKTVIAYVLTIFVLFLFATSGLINNANIQTQLKNGAYYAGLFSGLVAILIAIDFLGL